MHRNIPPLDTSFELQVHIYGSSTLLDLHSGLRSYYKQILHVQAHPACGFIDLSIHGTLRSCWFYCGLIIHTQSYIHVYQ